MRMDHGAPGEPSHPVPGQTMSSARPTEGSRLLASGRLGAVLVAAAHAALARRAEMVVREAGLPTTLDRGGRS
jgi:hypothetical protein